MTYPRVDVSGAVPLTRVIGIGNAGVHLADRVAMANLRGVEVVGLNTEIQSLAGSVVPRKCALGPRATRGLGAGGDPEVGREAAVESVEEIRYIVEGASVVIVLCGLGGGTGSGVGPVVAKMAKEAGAFVIVLLTMPFGFEGKRRRRQAEDAYAFFGKYAQVLLRFENDRMAELSSPRAAIAETFAASDEMLYGCVASLVEMLHGRGPVPMTLGNLASAIGVNPATFFGRGIAEGDNRAHEAVERVLRSPLLDRGRVLREACAVVVHITCPMNFSFVETMAVMKQISKFVAEQATLSFGVSVDGGVGSSVSVTVLGACNREVLISSSEGISDSAGAEQPCESDAFEVFSKAKMLKYEGNEVSRGVSSHGDQHLIQCEGRISVPGADVDSNVERKDSAATTKGEQDMLFPSPPGRLIADDAVEKKEQVRHSTLRHFDGVKHRPRVERPKLKQEMLQFENVARGRFEKVEPTIVEGENLDVPTFLRVKSLIDKNNH